MNGMAPPTDDQPTPPPLPPPPDDLPPAASSPTATGTPRIIGGVCAVLADGLGVDALWVRIGFVLLALVGGLGLVVYAALWLLLVVAPTGRSRFPAVLGGAILVAGLPIILGGFSFDSPLTLMIVLAGLALALWQPRPDGPRATLVPGPRVDFPYGQDPGGQPGDQPPGDGVRTTWARMRPPPRPRDRSPLGAITLGVAMVVAAGGALVDQANGGRLHPEQWLGAAVIVCGIGLLVGTLRGHARWLIVPAVALAGAGMLTGEMARLDIGVSDWSGERWVWVGPDTVGPITAKSGLGNVSIHIDHLPAAPVQVDARVAVGTISINTSDRVAVDVHRDGGPAERLGRSDGPADVVVEARVGLGRVSLSQWFDLGMAEEETIPGRPEGIGELAWIADGVGMTTDGWFVLGDGEVVIDDQNRVVLGEPMHEANDVTRIFTAYGDFSLLPRGLLITPFQQVIDLEAIRSEMVATPTDEDPPPEPDTGAGTTTDGDSTAPDPEGAQP